MLWSSLPSCFKLRSGRMPAPQENFGDFFIWKSLKLHLYDKLCNTKPFYGFPEEGEETG